MFIQLPPDGASSRATPGSDLDETGQCLTMPPLAARDRAQADARRKDRKDRTTAGACITHRVRSGAADVLTCTFPLRPFDAQ
jgi:hypothetical protein